MANTHLYKPHLVIVISGPSGAGKSTVTEALCESDKTLRLSVSATTREPRQGEVDGVDYHFLSRSEFEKAVQADRFLEWAEYGDNLYGTLKSEIEAARETGRDAILVIDPDGSSQIRRQNLTSARGVFIYIVPLSFADLETRLRNRQTESETELKKRLDIAKTEVREIRHYDYWITNPENAVQDSVQQIQAIVCAERARIDAKLIESLRPLLGLDYDD